MSRPKKIALLLVILIPVVLVVGVWLFLDALAKKAVEVGGEQAMGVPTRLDSIRLNPLAGQGSIEGLEVSNPQGFESPYFMRLAQGDAHLDIGSLTEDTVVMKTIELEGLRAYLEKSKMGANYEVILGNMRKGEEKAPAEEEPGKKFLVEQIVVRNIDVRADVAVAGEKLSSVDLHIDEIRLENLGTETGSGVVMSQLMGTIVKAVLTAIIQQGARVLPEVMVNGLGVGLKGLGKVGVKVVGNVTANVGGKAVEVLGGVGKAVGGAAKDAIKGVGGILGGGGDEEDK